MLAAERAALELERASARQDRAIADKAVRAAERASEALEFDAVRARGARSEGGPATEGPSQGLGARASPVACAPKKEDVPPIPRRAPPPRGGVVADAPQSPPEKPAASVKSAPSQAGARYKEPPMMKTAVADSAGATVSQARYKEPPMQKPQQTASSPALQRSEPATKLESVARDFEDEFDDARRWAEASAPPGKAPPEDSPYYRVMPAPKKTPKQDLSLPPSSALSENGSAASGVSSARFKAAPSRPGAAPEQASAKSSRYSAPQAEFARNGFVPAAPRAESEASSVTGSVTSLRSRVKAPPSRPAARPLPAAAD